MRVLAGAPFQIPPWQRSAMHSSRKGDHAGAAPAGGSDFHNKEEAVAVAQESEFLAVNQKIRVRIPAVTPLRKARTRQSRRTIGLQNRITRCESGARVHFGAIVQ